MKSDRISFSLTPLQRKELEASAKAMGLERTDYIRHRLFAAAEDAKASSTEFYRELVESCARLVPMPRTQLEPLVALVLSRVHQHRKLFDAAEANRN
jgi:hypothetical protein